MSTRRASGNAPLSQERYMSSREFAERRGLSGTAVAAKAELQSAKGRSLLLFLEARSKRQGGLGQVASALLEIPERLGTPSMHQFGVRPGQAYNADQVKAVRSELGDEFMFPLHGEFDADGLHAVLMSRVEEEDRQRALKHPKSYPASAFLNRCRQLAAEGLEKHIVELCLDPSVPVEGAAADPRYYRGLVEALWQYKCRHEEKALAGFAQTAISRTVFKVFSRGLSSRRMVVVQGLEGVGKSHSAEAWCEQHLGEARFVRIDGIVSRTTFFQAVSSALGLASSASQKSQEMQTRVLRHLERSGLMIVIDEAHRLFSQTQRMYSHPELLNWIYTLSDFGVPAALIVTPQFLSRMEEAERQTDWRSGQFKRRVLKWETLDEKLCETDLRAVAALKAPRYSKRMLDELVDFALQTRPQLDAINRAVSGAAFTATEQGREEPNLADLQAGIDEARCTGLAMTTRVDRKRQMTRATGVAAEPLRGQCTPSEPVLQGDFARPITPAPETPVRGARPALV